MDETDAVRVFDKIVEGDDRELGDVSLETSHGELEFTMTAVARETRMTYANAGVGGISAEDLDIDPDNVEDMSDSELMEMVMDSDTELAALLPDADRVDAAEDVVAESLEHDELASTEVETLVTREFSDDVLFGLAEEIVKASKDVGGVSKFRVVKHRG